MDCLSHAAGVGGGHGRRRTERPAALDVAGHAVRARVLGVCGFLLAAAVSDAEAKSLYVEQLLNALLFPLGASMVSFGLWATHRVNPVYDTRIYAFEKFSASSSRSSSPSPTTCCDLSAALRARVTRCSPWR